MREKHTSCGLYGPPRKEGTDILPPYGCLLSGNAGTVNWISTSTGELFCFAGLNCHSATAETIVLAVVSPSSTRTSRKLPAAVRTPRKTSVAVRGCAISEFGILV